MSGNSLLEKYVGTKSDATVETGPEQEPDDLGSFGFLRGTRDRAIMLELRKKNGNIWAISYAWMERAEFDPSEGITLFAAGQKIRLTGRNLNAEIRRNTRLFQSLTRHRVTWIQEADEATTMQAGPEETLVERIEW